MNCTRPCYSEPTFDYKGMACFLQENMQYAQTGMKVVVMIKDKYNPGKFKYVEKPVIYFIPNDQESSPTIVAYIAPGHDNSYNYMYLLSKRLDKEYNIFAGDHFTMGLKDSKTFDLHYTSYDYKTQSRPSHLYYNLYIDDKTSPRDITKLVCSTKLNNRYDETLSQRCYFFDNLMKYVHNNNYCTKQFHSKFITKTSYIKTGGNKRKQCGGNEVNKIKNINEIDEPFRNLITHLESKVGDIPKLQSIEMHMMNNNKGILTYCIDDDNVESIQISVSGVQEHNGQFRTYYALPFDFKTYEFISIEELVDNLNPSIGVKTVDLRVPLNKLVICDNETLNYQTIIDTAKTPRNKIKTCAHTRINATSLLPVRVPVSAGGKVEKLNKWKTSTD